MFLKCKTVCYATGLQSAIHTHCSLSLSYLSVCVWVCDCLTGNQSRRSLHRYDVTPWACVMVESWGVMRRTWGVRWRRVVFGVSIKVAFHSWLCVKDLPRGFTQRCKSNQPSRCATMATVVTALR